MAIVRYTITKDQKPTEEQMKMMKEGSRWQEEMLAQGRKDLVYDEDCPETDPVTTPKRYEAMMKAVAERNRRLEEEEKQQA